MNDRTEADDSMHSALGSDDPFRQVADLLPDETRAWVRSLDLRAMAADQISMRQELIRRMRVEEGDIVVDVGCGTGVLLAELAHAIGLHGRAIGVEPQPAFAEAARNRLFKEAVADRAVVLISSGDSIELPDDYAQAAVAQSVLIHLSEEILRKTLQEMVRVVAREGRIVCLDQDGDTWVIDHPDRELTHRIVQFNSDQRYMDSWTGRKLRRHFIEAGLTDIDVSAYVHLESGRGSYLFEMAERVAASAVSAGVVPKDDGERWTDALRTIANEDRFFSSINYYLSSGQPKKG